MDTLVVFLLFSKLISSLQLAVSAIQSSAQSWKKLLQTIKNNFFLFKFLTEGQKKLVQLIKHRKDIFCVWKTEGKLLHYTYF
jgi:hypothetical protein